MLGAQASLPLPVFHSEPLSLRRTPCRLRPSSAYHARCAAETVFYKIEGGGHTWPSMESEDFYPDVGATSLELAATDTVVAFLLRQRR